MMWSTGLLRAFFGGSASGLASLLETAVWAFPLSYLAGLAATASQTGYAKRQAARLSEVGRRRFEAPSALPRYISAGVLAILPSRPNRDMQADQQNTFVKPGAGLCEHSGLIEIHELDLIQPVTNSRHPKGRLH